MRRYRLWLLAAGLLVAAAPLASAAPPTRQEVEALAARIDHHVAGRWAKAGAEPAPRADDAEFLRRTYLDLAGRIPSVAEARAFLDDPASDKRLRLVERLLDSPRYVTHFTGVWRALMLPESNTSFQARFTVPGFEEWLKKQLRKNATYDQMVRELLTAAVSPEGAQNVFNIQAGGEPTPIGYYIAKDVKPENLAASAARLFMGVRLECAQCHNHPFANWKREQFWSLAAFFAGVQRQGQGDFAFPGREMPDKREITIPGTDRVVQASFLDGSEPQFKYKASARQTLAEWLTAKENPYFARATANRLWAYFFGTGLVDPVDEMIGTESAPSHPELLDELAREFAAHDFDLKFLMRAITASRAYQLTSAGAGKGQDEAQLFARMAVRGLTPEQLYDSVAEATGFRDPNPVNDPRIVAFGPGSPRAEFLQKFANQSDKSTEAQTSILQALALMNGRLIADATSLERSETLAAVVDAPFLNTAQRVEALFLASLSRKPTSKELARLVRFVEDGGSKKDLSPDKALADVFWVLLNSGEFILNH